jgi:uncharacterized protein (TIGR01244 family)
MTHIKTLNDSFAVSAAPPSEGDLRALAEDGYKAVVNLRCQDEADQPNAPDREGEVVASLGLEYRHLPVAGGAMSDELVDEFRASVEALPKPVLVHCASGKPHMSGYHRKLILKLLSVGKVNRKAGIATRGCAREILSL